ncbi:2-oxoadipate dehydrogenase complex component E1-like [Panonychus citri]|uniref:2-oxoadipate dehydrogenase complex component E1-like n=1 Tax=Panonychus citri TaxID=50023 RepID=UPI002307D997|nr:2-oxoadipate dehydrogenase complex component E1-like [Panonychus citri]
MIPIPRPGNCLNRIRMNLGLIGRVNRSSFNHVISGYRFYQTKDVFGVKPFDKDRAATEMLIKRIVTNEQSTSYLTLVVDEFRAKGHLLAATNPLGPSSPSEPNHSSTELLRRFIEQYQDDHHTEINANDYTNLNLGRCSLGHLVRTLESVYCSTVGVEFMHLSDLGEREWFASEWEKIGLNENHLTEQEAQQMAIILMKSELFDKFVATKFPTVKRYSAEGAEAMLVSLDTILRTACNKYSIWSAIIGMPHRGRLNFLDILLKYPAATQFRKMSGLSEFDLTIENIKTTGDVLSHLFTTVRLNYAPEKQISVSLLPNPSHLEAVSPVVMGKARSKAMRWKEGSYGLDNKESAILPIQIHGDAAFSGQGVIMETLALSGTPNFTVNGSLHLIVNNSIGYTTPGQVVGRSSAYCSDVIKMIDAPCIHVNGDCPEDVIKVSKLALKYRQTFCKDIAIDLSCFRRWGHNELDDPTMTNPVMYKWIHSRSSTMPTTVSDKYLPAEVKESESKKYWDSLNDAHKSRESYVADNGDLQGVWSSCVRPGVNVITTWDTGVPLDVLSYVGHQSVTIPEGFNLHPNLAKVLVSDRLKRLQSPVNEPSIDWSTSETLALGSLLYQGINVRLSGQDVGRGTFSQRHAMLVDQTSGKLYIPLNNLSSSLSPSTSNPLGSLEVANSILSEEAVLAFEYGFSVDSPNNMVLWEAQFGDFFNGAQIILDTFVSSGEAKWLLQSGLTILLPHGYDGAGPEHSSCRLERFLQMSDSSETGLTGDAVNWSIANVTTPAQYFHLLRRQMIRNYRKPLVLASPKLLLRHPACVSPLNTFGPGNHFQSILPDPRNPLSPQRIIFCSGKHYYTLDEERVNRKLVNKVIIIRLEELSPFPTIQISKQLSKLSNIKDIVWSQEEHRNMGAWTYIKPRFENNLGIKIKYAGRDVSSVPAVGIGAIYKQQSKSIVDQTFEGL